METTVRLEAPCPPAVLFGYVDDLAAYPQWLALARRATAVDPGPDGAPAWSVELRGRVGPLTRSKVLRMARTAWEPDRLARFERRELDGREHGRWVLEAVVDAAPAGSRLAMALRYEGGLWAPVFERLLAEEVERSGARLLALVSDPPG